MVILGIDPGTARMGWGVVKIKSASWRSKNPEGGDLQLLGYGCVVTSKNDGVGKRLVLLRRELRKILSQHKPDVCAVERLFFGMNAKTAISVGQATGVIMLTVSECRIPTVEYSSLSVKLAVAGYGRADKKEVARRIRQILGVNRRTLSFTAKDRAWDDASDALAIAIHHALHRL